MKKTITFAAIGITICIFLYGLFIFLAIKDSNECDESVTFLDGSTIECRSACSYEDNTTHIRKCDGQLIIVPTIRIKEIKK